MTRKNSALAKQYDRNVKLGRPSFKDKMDYNVDRVLENVFIKDDKTSSTILDRVRGKQIAVHGSRAVIKQTPPNISMQIRRKDWDLIVTRNAKMEARMIEDALDRAFNSNMFYVKALGPGYGSNSDVVFRVISRADGKPIVDIKESTTLPPHVIIDDVRYKTLLELLKRAKKILNDPKLKYRHWKARRDISIINRAIEQMKNKRVMIGIIPWKRLLR